YKQPETALVILMPGPCVGRAGSRDRGVVAVKVGFDGLLSSARQVLDLIGSSMAAGEVREDGTIGATFLLVYVDRVEHFVLLSDPARLFQAGMLHDAAQCWCRDILLGMRHRDFAGLGGVLELVMRSNGMH